MKTLTRIVISRLLAALLLATPVDGVAQVEPLVMGEEVRVIWTQAYPNSVGFTTHRSVVGELVDQNATHMMVRRGARFVTVPMSTVKRVERRIGTKPASAPAMVIGSGIGFGAGFMAGILTRGNRSTTTDERINKGIATGVLLGAPVGALVAYITSRQRGIYEEVGFASLLSGLAVAPSGRVGVSVKVGGG
jgi:hypothetical protein